jgi:tryptophanyl-tRNA synthetase
MTEYNVDPWKVSGIIDYNDLIIRFGTELIDQVLLDRLSALASKKGMVLHPWLRRGIFFSHRQLNLFLDAYDSGKDVFLYTGRGPTSESLHLGHMIPFMMIKWLQDLFDCNVIVQMADDEKYYFKDLDFKTITKMMVENVKDIIACGFNPEKTYIFSNRDYRLNCEEYEILVSTMKKLIPTKTVMNTFGFNMEDPKFNVGQLDWPFYQSAAAFSAAYPSLFYNKNAMCLVIYAIDQDPYFRMARDFAEKLRLAKPCALMSRFIPPLTGADGKMSSSLSINGTLYLNESIEVISKKIKKYSFSGGGGDGTKEDHIKYGGNIDTDISFIYLNYFESDDQILEKIKQDFIAGKLFCGDLKSHITTRISELFQNHQNLRKTIKSDHKLLQNLGDNLQNLIGLL